MTALLIVIGFLVITNLSTLLALYKLVTQLSSKVMARDLSEYQVAQTPPLKRERKEVGHKPVQQELVPINEVSLEDLHESLAFQAGRINELREP